VDPLTPDELARYSRQIVLPEIGVKGQQRLRAARVLCIGAGGLGSPVAMYLAAAGVGTLGIVDDDVVELSNLHRQLMHATKDVGRPKLESARDSLQALNPSIQIEEHPMRFTEANADQLVGGYDIVIDGSDNLETRYASNDACVRASKPNVYGSISRFEGQASVFAPHLGGPCYRCLFPDPPPAGSVPSCAENGVLGVLPGIVGSIQALETIKLIVGMEGSLLGRLLHLDAASMRFREFKLRRDPECRVCGEHPVRAAAPREPLREVLPSISAAELKARLSENPRILLVDVRESFERDIAMITDSEFIPLHTLAARTDSLPRDRDIALICHTGMRSAIALEMLQQQGFSRLWNVTGGIDAWAVQVEPTMKRY